MPSGKNFNDLIISFPKKNKTESKQINYHIHNQYNMYKRIFQYIIKKSSIFPNHV